MNSDNYGEIPHPEKLDADAVCAKCNTVNSEGTLLCKTCGNNLRDQRAIRLAADQAMDLDQTGLRRRTWLSGIMFLLALGLIISTLLNQELIVEWLSGGGSTPVSAAQELWRGPYNEIFDPMVTALSATNVTEERALAALETPVASTSLNGVYALFFDDTFVGSAMARLDGSDLYVVALLDNGDEVRGRAVEEGNHFTATPENLAVQNRGRISAARGVAMPQGGGVVDCIGGETSRNPVTFSAYQMPPE